MLLTWEGPVNKGFTVFTRNETKHEKFDVGCQIEKLVFGFEEEVIIPGKYCRAGAPVKSCYALGCAWVHSRPGGAWNQQRLSRVATITNFNMAAVG